MHQEYVRKRGLIFCILWTFDLSNECIDKRTATLHDIEPFSLGSLLVRLKQLMTVLCKLGLECTCEIV